jgi:hypothetical protein
MDSAAVAMRSVTFFNQSSDYALSALEHVHDDVFYVFGVETFGNRSCNPDHVHRLVVQCYCFHPACTAGITCIDDTPRMTCTPKPGGRLLAQQRKHFFLPVVTLFTILSEFQRFHQTVFRRLIIHSLADPNCILKHHSAHSVCIVIHRLLCYITK